MAEEAEAAAVESWSFDLSRKCKVEQELEVFVSDAPIATAEELAAWTASQLEPLEERQHKKRYDFAEDTAVSLD